MNGYSNDDTWAMATLIDNDEYFYEEVNRMAGHYDSSEDDVEFLTNDLVKFARLNTDEIKAENIDIQEVDFHEIAEAWLSA